jgi:WhiB family redox-sensing transcriptional regulator
LCPFLTLVTDSSALPAEEPMAATPWTVLSPADDAWRLDALCAETDPEAFFPEKGGSTREAKRVCTGCEVRAECLEYALANDERFGIWGGLSERERRRVRLQRRDTASA